MYSRLSSVHVRSLHELLYVIGYDVIDKIVGTQVWLLRTNAAIGVGMTASTSTKADNLAG
jgi:hypothetical protein